MLKEFLQELGWNLQLALAGFWGGVVATLVFRQAKPIEAVSMVIVGFVTANYLGAVAVKYTGFSELPTGFVVGLSGMTVCRGIVLAVQAVKFGPARNGDGSKT